MNSKLHETVKLNLMNAEFQRNGENNFVNSKLKRNGEKKYAVDSKWVSVHVTLSLLFIRVTNFLSN